MELPKYFYFRLHPSKKGAAVEIEDASDVDVVEVVRCKDCKHKHIENSVWTCPFGLPGGPEFFCGYGAETRGEEHEDIPMEYYENGGI